MKVYNALALAAQLHGNQKYGKEPYMLHVAQVVEVLRYYGVEDEDVLAAGALHDVIEDCAVTVGVLEQLFGEKVAKIVELVSNPQLMVRFYGHTEYYMEHESWDTAEDIIERRKLSRKEKHEYQYPLLAQNRDARIVKMADRLANVMSGDFVDMYRSEHDIFKIYIYVPDTNLFNGNFLELRMRQDLDELLKWGLTNTAA
jgi:(p)ppGpp synthase/HD superfamily hydrolase